METVNPHISWFHPRWPSRVRAVAFMIHGLNLNPIRMKAIASVLNELNISVGLLSLQGHGENYRKQPGRKAYLARMETFRSVTYKQWRNEARTAYESVRAAADERKVPLIFVGYSLGALLGCDLLVSLEDVGYDRMILFAPALATHMLSQSLKILTPLKRAIIPSMSPRHYRANSGTPLSAYLALLDASAHFTLRANQRLNVPTVVFIDKQDELVSFNRLKKFVAHHQLDQWQIVRLRKNLLESVIKYSHLIIDENSAGIKEWEKVRKYVKAHLEEITK